MKNVAEMDRDSDLVADMPPDRIETVEDEIAAREFWATHSSVPYLEGTEDVTDSPPAQMGVGPGPAGSTARRRSQGERMVLISLRLPTEVIEEVKLVAAARHLPYQTLMRSWIGERLDQERENVRRGA